LSNLNTITYMCLTHCTIAYFSLSLFVLHFYCDGILDDCPCSRVSQFDGSRYLQCSMLLFIRGLSQCPQLLFVGIIRKVSMKSIPRESMMRPLLTRTVPPSNPHTLMRGQWDANEWALSHHSRRLQLVLESNGHLMDWLILLWTICFVLLRFSTRTHRRFSVARWGFSWIVWMRSISWGVN